MLKQYSQYFSIVTRIFGGELVEFNIDHQRLYLLKVEKKVYYINHYTSLHRSRQTQTHGPYFRIILASE